MTTPDWESFDSEGTCNIGLFFDWHEMNKEENYLPFVRENENHGIGGLNPGHYHRSADFGMVIRSAAENEEQLNN